jgi:E1A/CREB-binding protein
MNPKKPTMFLVKYAGKLRTDFSSLPYRINENIDNDTLFSKIETRKQRINQQHSQRLLILRHASKCIHQKEGLCKMHLCWATKSLWKHIMICSNNLCTVSNCFTSRYSLKHYSMCDILLCAVCDSTRTSIKTKENRNSELYKGAECLHSMRNSIRSLSFAI